MVVRKVPRAAIGVVVEHEAISVVTQAVERGGSPQAIGRKRLIPFGQIEIAGDDRGGGLVALGDQLVQILVGGRTKWFEPEVVDGEQFDTHQAGEPALVGAGGARGVQAGRELGAGGEQHIHALAHGTMAECLGQTALAGAARPDDEHGRVFAEVTAAGQIVHECAVQLR